MYINFDGKYEFNYAYDMLKREILNRLAPESDVPDGGSGMCDYNYRGLHVCKVHVIQPMTYFISTM